MNSNVLEMPATAMAPPPEPGKDGMETRSLTLKQQAEALEIIDQRTYDAAAELVKAVKEMLDKAEAHHRPIIDAAHKTHKAALGALQSVTKPLEESERILKNRIAAYTLEQQRKQRAAEEEAMRQEQLAQEQALEQQIEDAEAQGAAPEEIKAMTETPIVVTKPAVEPTITKAKGITVVERYSCEVTNLRLLCKEIAEGRQPVTLVAANMPALNGMARTLKTGFNIPGCRLVREASTSVR